MHEYKRQNIEIPWKYITQCSISMKILLAILMLINIVQVFQDDKVLRKIYMWKMRIHKGIGNINQLINNTIICTQFLQISFSFSRTMNDKFGCRTFISLAVAIPTIPPPMTATSYSPPFWLLIREIKSGLKWKIALTCHFQ